MILATWEGLKMKNQLACEVLELPVLVGTNLVIPIHELQVYIVVVREVVSRVL